MVVFPPEPPVVNCPVAERSSPSRVRYAAPKTGAPLTAAGRSAQREIATGGSGGKTTLKVCHTATICQRFTGRSSPYRGLHQGGVSSSSCATGLFRGRPVYPNSIFADGSHPFPQMDVWSRWLCADHRAGHVDPSFNGSQTTNRGAIRQAQASASENSPAKCREKYFFP